MQTLDVISVNIWQILISLLNLVLLFFILKKLLFKPVKNILAKRQAEIDSQYDAADQAKNEAEQSRIEYEEKLSGARRKPMRYFKQLPILPSKEAIRSWQRLN